MTTYKTVQGLIGELTDGKKFHRERRIDFGNFCVGVLLEDDRLDGLITEYFREFLTESRSPDILIKAVDGQVPDLGIPFAEKEPEPGKEKIKEEFADLPDGRIVRKKLTGVHFFFSVTENLVIGPCVENHNQVVNFVNNRYIEFMLKRGALLFHSSAVCHGDRGFAISGFSGAGKSTLSLHLLSRGLDFVSNDRLMVQREEEATSMYGVAKYPRINPGTILNNSDLAALISTEERAELLELSLEELWKLEQKYDLFIDDIYGSGRFSLTAPMNALVILNWNRSSQEKTGIAKIDAANRLDLFPAFVKSPGLFYFPDGTEDFTNGRYASLLQGLDVFEVTGEVDFDYAADFFISYLGMEK